MGDQNILVTAVLSKNSVSVKKNTNSSIINTFADIQEFVLRGALTDLCGLAPLVVDLIEGGVDTSGWFSMDDGQL